jgi:hypothetical protein
VESGEISGQRHILDALDEIKKEQIQHGMLLEQVLKQALKTNGRVDILENWKRVLELRDAHNKGILEGRGDALITKGHWRVIMAILGGVTALASGVAAIVAIIAGGYG